MLTNTYWLVSIAVQILTTIVTIMIAAWRLGRSVEARLLSLETRFDNSPKAYSVADIDAFQKSTHLDIADINRHLAAVEARLNRIDGRS